MRYVVTIEGKAFQKLRLAVFLDLDMAEAFVESQRLPEFINMVISEEEGEV